jgi:hypothetical protein
MIILLFINWMPKHAMTFLWSTSNSKKALEMRLCIVEFEYPGKGFMQMLHLLLEKVSLVYYANLSSNISLQAGSHLPHELIVCNVFSLSKGGTVRVLF